MSVIGYMMHDMHCNRPNIVFAIRKPSQYIVKPRMENLKVVGRLLGLYLKGISTLEMNAPNSQVQWVITKSLVIEVAINNDRSIR